MPNLKRCQASNLTSNSIPTQLFEILRYAQDDRVGFGPQVGTAETAGPWG